MDSTHASSMMSVPVANEFFYVPHGETVSSGGTLAMGTARWGNRWAP